MSETVTREKLDFNKAVAQLRRLFKLEVAQGQEEGEFTLLDTNPLRVRPGQTALTAENISDMGEAALLYEQLSFTIREVTAAREALARATHHVAHIGEFYALALVAYTGQTYGALAHLNHEFSSGPEKLLAHLTVLRDEAENVIKGTNDAGKAAKEGDNQV